ncbi:tyrosine-type recombinase/integrase [Phycicoccus duodecadis]|uniref:Site-specific recombinase XerD n=1 Tax=Phycicoccus duodecadis TaxID=173053 RepID=A0A2N3YID9_9MICO|nr:site-specific integrase [Phycicoccus duodecadis]PKW26616.1 site-specific recombinase XerD [Phycicoccus duodecadis]
MAAARGRRGFGRVRKLPSGRYQASFVAPDLRRLNAPTTFTTKADAEGWLALERQRVAGGDWQRPKPSRREPPTTFGSYASTWVSTRELKPKTREGYEHLLKRYLDPALGTRVMAEINTADVRAWWNQMDPSKPTGRARSYALLKAVLNTAVADELIAANPCRIRGASNTTRAREIRPASTAEIDLIAGAMPSHFRALVLLGAWCALRVGELLELRRRDVNLQDRTVRIERAVSQVHGRPVVGTPKSAAGTRTVSIPPHVVPFVTAHLDTYVGRERNSLLFPGADGVSNLQPSTLYRSWAAARAAAGRPDLRLHDLRHTGATMAARAGATLAELQQRLGHSSVNAALRYQHAAQGRDRQIADALSEMAARATE